MDLFSQYATDAAAEEEGREFDFGGGIKMLIARSYNPKFKRMLNQQYEAHKHTLDLKDTPEQVKAAEELNHKLMAKIMAASVLLGWTGPVVFQKEPLPYSAANAEKLLLMKEFQKAINAKADDYRNYRVQTEEADEKNSSTSSSGN